MRDRAPRVCAERPRCSRNFSWGSLSPGALACARGKILCERGVQYSYNSGARLTSSSATLAPGAARDASPYFSLNTIRTCIRGPVLGSRLASSHHAHGNRTSASRGRDSRRVRENEKKGKLKKKEIKKGELLRWKVSSRSSSFDVVDHYRR